MKTQIKKALISSSFLFLPALAFAQQPVGVGAAITASGFDCTFIVIVAGEGTYTPLLPFGSGIINVPMSENTHIVFSNSANGNRTLNCTGTIKAGTTVSGIDQVTGAWATGVASSLPEVCEELAYVAPEVCRGNGAVIVNSNTTPFLCRIPGETDAWTTRWKQTTSPSGKYGLNCSSKDEE